MKTIAILLLLGIITSTAGHAGPMMGMSGDMGVQASSPPHRSLLESPNASRKSRALMMLREQALQMRTDDGGSLSPEHRAQLQAKLDAIQAGNY
jgi:hypothetical protein